MFDSEEVERSVAKVVKDQARDAKTRTRIEEDGCENGHREQKKG